MSRRTSVMTAEQLKEILARIASGELNTAGEKRDAK